MLYKNNFRFNLFSEDIEPETIYPVLGGLERNLQLPLSSIDQLNPT
jgi:hypothetical protein